MPRDRDITPDNPLTLRLWKEGTMEEPSKRINVAIKDDLHRQVKIRAAQTRKTVTELVEAALRLYLDGNQPRDK